MNDPHVAALHYHVNHDDSLDYDNADPLEQENDQFQVGITDRKVTFRLKDHYTSIEEAKAALEPFVRQWEFLSTLESGSRAFALRYSHAEVIDRNPPPTPPGVIRVDAGPIGIHWTVSIPSVRVGKGSYPRPPSGSALNPDASEVRDMLSRFDQYHLGRAGLADVAYLCLTVLEDSFPKGVKNRRGKLSRYYGIAPIVIAQVGRLSSGKGGPLEARKSSGRHEDYTQEDRDFLVNATRAFIRRAAEKAAAPDESFTEITKENLGSF